MYYIRKLFYLVSTFVSLALGDITQQITSLIFSSMCMNEMGLTLSF
jgi:hypothetical protein